jgi:hypothetical protein
VPTNVLSRPNFVKQQIRTGRPDISNAPCPNPSHQNRNKVKSRIHTLLRTYLCHICQQFEMKNMYIVKVQGPPHAKWWWTIQQIWRLSSSVYVCSRVPKRLTCNQRAKRLCNSTRSHQLRTCPSPQWRTQGLHQSHRCGCLRWQKRYLALPWYSYKSHP